MVAFVGLLVGESSGGEWVSLAGADRFMPARARSTDASPSRGSYECCEAAAEETADCTGEVEVGVMCDRSTGEDWENGGVERQKYPVSR